MKNGETSKAKIIIRSLNSIVDHALLVLLFAVAAIALYALWDAHQVYAAADSARYQTYKPSEEDSFSYDELRGMNHDVMGWLTVYDTKIDYPVMNSRVSNDEYLSRNPFGEIEASGSLFIDHNNSKNWTDFNTIIFGHHMAERAMFGDLDRFLTRSYFDKHRYGNLYYGGKNHGVQFFAMLELDAHTREIYHVPAVSEEEKKQYLDYIFEHAKFLAETDVGTRDRIVLLSTCSEDITNGRYILVGQVLNRTVKDPFEDKKDINTGNGIDAFGWFDEALKLPVWESILILLILLLIVFVLWRMEHNRHQKVLLQRNGKSDGK